MYDQKAAIRRELPASIRQRASVFRQMALNTTSARDKHDYTWQAQRLEQQAQKIEKENA